MGRGTLLTVKIDFSFCSHVELHALFSYTPLVQVNVTVVSSMEEVEGVVAIRIT